MSSGEVVPVTIPPAACVGVVMLGHVHLPEPGGVVHQNLDVTSGVEANMKQLALFTHVRNDGGGADISHERQVMLKDEDNVCVDKTKGVAK